jgi:hypothetical protein
MSNCSLDGILFKLVVDWRNLTNIRKIPAILNESVTNDENKSQNE